MTHDIKIIDSGTDRYLIEPKEITLGRQWDDNADEIIIERPEIEQNNDCVMIITDINGVYIDHIPMITNSYVIKSNVSMNKYVKIGFRFFNRDGYSKSSEIIIGKFLSAQKPYDFSPSDPTQKQDIDYLIGYGFTDSRLVGNELQFFNMIGEKVVSFDLSPFVQAQSDLGETDQTAETFVKGKKTSNLVNDGEDGTSPFATVAYVKDKLEIIKTDGKGDKYLADDGVYKEVRTNRSFNDNWKINGTTLEFIQSVLADEAATVGMSFLGGVKFSDLPAKLKNAECLVEIISSTLGSDEKVIHLDLYSSDTSPYHWSTIYYKQLLDPIWQPDVLQSDVDKKLDKTGGTISGNLSIQGNLNVAGTTVTKDTETLLVKDNIVVTNSDKVELLNLSGLAINKNANQTYGIMYDPTTDSVKLGLGSINETGKFTFSENGNPVAVRADSSLLVDGNLIKWDATNNRFVDSERSTDDFAVLNEENTFTGKQNFNTETEFNAPINSNADINITNNVVKILDATNNKDIVTQYGADKIIMEENGDGKPYSYKFPKKSGIIALEGEIQQDYSIVNEEPTDKSEGKMIYQKSFNKILGIVDKSQPEDVWYSDPTDFAEKISSDTITVNDLKNFKYALLNNSVDQQGKYSLVGYINVGKLTGLDTGTLPNTLSVTYKINSTLIENELFTKDEDDLFRNESDSFGLIPSTQLVASDELSGYFAFSPVEASWKTTDTIEIIDIKKDGVSVLSSGSSKFDITNLKIADGTEYKSLKDFFGQQGDFALKSDLPTYTDLTGGV